MGTGGKSRSLEKDAAPRRFFTVLTVLEEIKGFVFDPIPLGHGGESIIITMARYDEEAGDLTGFGAISRPSITEIGNRYVLRAPSPCFVSSIFLSFFFLLPPCLLRLTVHNRYDYSLFIIEKTRPLLSQPRQLDSQDRLRRIFHCYCLYLFASTR